jgi:hypothetical protein
VTGQPEPRLEFCQFCGAPRPDPLQEKCSQCGGQLLHASEVSLGRAPSLVSGPGRMGRPSRTRIMFGLGAVGLVAVLCAAAVLAGAHGGAGRGTAPGGTATAVPSPTGFVYQDVFDTVNGLSVDRACHSATLLADGRVLIAGGISGKEVLSTAELYDPTLGTFAATGRMIAGRSSATATLLADGLVLIAGGAFDALGTAPLLSAELYDPKTGSFTSTGSMTVPRTGHTATLLPGGRVLIAGGRVDPDGHVVDWADLYDPESGTFSPTGSMTVPRTGHTATLLADGRVLVAGGSDGLRGLASTELYDPTSGTFSPSGSMVSPRTDHTATPLRGGSLLIAGGVDAHGNAIASAELYDPKTGLASATGPLMVPRYDHTATLLRDGRVLMTGGRTTSGGSESSEAEYYDPTGRFFYRSPLMTMSVSRASHTATLLSDGSVLIIGGWDGTGASANAQVEIYK